MSLTESESQRQHDMMRMAKIVKEKEETILEMAQTSEDTVALRTELMAKASLEAEIQDLRSKLREAELKADHITPQIHPHNPVMLAMQGKIANLEEAIRERDELLLRDSSKVTLTRGTQTNAAALDPPPMWTRQEQRQRPDQSNLRALVQGLLKEVHNLKAVATGQE